jgi:hypothetical protein
MLPGMPNIPTPLEGLTFGRWTVLSPVPNRRRYWLCRCRCGKEKEVFGASMTNGSSTSCGCYHNELTAARNHKHGLSGTKTHRIWGGMNRRCYDPGCKPYRYYGGRGITVCERWRESFAAFLEDMGECPPGLTLERIDNDGNYQPGNCRWATMLEQANNKRNIHWLTHNGITRSVSAWAKATGLRRQAIEKRLLRGWSVERALTTPSACPAI